VVSHGGVDSAVAYVRIRVKYIEAETDADGRQGGNKDPDRPYNVIVRSLRLDQNAGPT
jgi:hypothetical protein